ncbi:hypothetical protein LSTR_LSTR002711 [Laodelphax striatellus]|uniref:Uncharacterized protein n=1 Tax=Laodelphax striatellus TaxID=195883 RepID=A0A482X5D5_LAOST|nr:hypothetical protein LSTR_LSTR002711 [Laodelphax striatellus]
MLGGVVVLSMLSVSIITERSSALPIGRISNVEGDANIIIKQSPLSVRTLRDSSFPEPWLDSEAQSVPDRRLRRQLNFIQTKIADVLHPQPIVDTMKEEERYGNTVEHTFGKKVVRAIESLSKAINTAFEFPVNTVKKATKSATEALNAIGGKIVGLQK